ncbi:MAG TPA: hypothetical protein VHY08_22015 [Bacillota bacterium]|nr:hypothetical protein [Bacillota bacterium]
MNDRFTQGFIAGVIGWIPQELFTLIMFYGFHNVKFRYHDFAALIAFNYKPNNIWDTIFAELLVIIFVGFLGAGFSMLIKTIHSANLHFKGWAYGVIWWFMIYCAITLFTIKGIYQTIDSKTALINLIAACIWGVCMARVFLFLNRKSFIQN